MLFKDGEVVEGGAVIKALNELDERLVKLDGHVGEIGPLAEMCKDMQKQMNDALRRDTPAERKAFAQLDKAAVASLGFEILHKAKTKPSRLANGFAEEPDDADIISKFQQECDFFYIFCAYGGMIDRETGRPNAKALSTKYYKDHFRPLVAKTREFMVKEGFDTATAGEGLEYVPTDHSSRLFDLVELEPGLANYFESIPMTRGRQDFPSWLDNFDLAIMPERTADGYDASTTGRAPDMLGSKNMTGLIEMNAVKFGGILFWSKEVEEDSIVPLLPLLQRKVVRGAKRTQDKSMIHGDTAGTHQDTDIAAGASTLAEKAYDGLRKAGIAGTAKVDAGSNSITTDAAWNQYIRACKGLMGEYGVYKDRLVRIWSTVGENQIGSVPKFALVSAFGDGASVRGGDATTGIRRDGIEDVISFAMRDDLNNQGVNGASGNNFTAALIVNRDAWATGVRREIRLEMSKERFFEFDMDALKVTMRRHFKRVQPVGQPTGYVYNIGL